MSPRTTAGPLAFLKCRAICSAFSPPSSPLFHISCLTALGLMKCPRWRAAIRDCKVHVSFQPPPTPLLYQRMTEHQRHAAAGKWMRLWSSGRSPTLIQIPECRSCPSSFPMTFKEVENRSKSPLNSVLWKQQKFVFAVFSFCLFTVNIFCLTHIYSSFSLVHIVPGKNGSFWQKIVMSQREKPSKKCPKSLMGLKDIIPKSTNKSKTHI